MATLLPSRLTPVAALADERLVMDGRDSEAHETDGIYDGASDVASGVDNGAESVQLLARVTSVKQEAIWRTYERLDILKLSWQLPL